MNRSACLWFLPTLLIAGTSYGESPPPRGEVKGAVMEANLLAPGMSVEYLRRTGKPELDIWVRIAAELGLIERMIAPVDATYTLPSPLPIVVGRCDRINAFYSPGAHRVVLCGELLDYFDHVFQQTADSDESTSDTRRKTMQATQFTMFHELGHAFVGELRLPATGREEDVADQFAVYLSASTGQSDVLVRGLESAMEWFDYEAKHKGTNLNFADEHSLDMQRYYNIACWAYGAYPEKYADLGATVPEKRRKRCASEWRQLKFAFDTILEPHRRPEEERQARIQALQGKMPDKGEFQRRLQPCEAAFLNMLEIKNEWKLQKLQAMTDGAAREAATAQYKEHLITWSKRISLDCPLLPWSKAKVSCLTRATTMAEIGACPVE